MASSVANSHDPQGTQEFSSPRWGILMGVRDRKFELKEHRITIGRDETCTISLQFPKISQHHCAITFDEENGVVTIEDTSSNGTYINGHRFIHDTRNVVDGDEIAVVRASPEKNRAKVSYIFKECFLNKYTIEKSLGEGSFGKVNLVTTRVCDSENTEVTQYAMKVINKEQWLQLLQQRTHRRISLLDEAKIMQAVGNHENAVSLIEYWQTKHNMYILMDFCDGGDMLNYIQQNGAYSNEHARNLFKQLTDAISYMHNTLSIAHRDLKPDNILLCGKNSEKLKLSDFGISRECTQMCKTIIGTPLYQAPEVQFRRENHHAGYDGKVSDIWSMGVILFVMLVGAPPFVDDENVVKVVVNHNLKWWNEPVVDTAKDLIYKMLNVEPENRLTAKQVLEHAWMLGLDTWEEYKSGVQKPKSDKDKDTQNGNNSNNFDFDKDEEKGVDEDSDADDDQDDDQDDTKNCSNGSENSNENSHSSYTKQNKNNQLKLASSTNTTIQKSNQQLKSSQLSDEVESHSVSPSQSRLANVVSKNNSNNNDSEEEDDDLKFLMCSNGNPEPSKSLKRKCRSPVASSCYTDDVDMNNNNNHNHNPNNHNNQDNTNNINEICDVVDEPAKKRRRKLINNAASCPFP